MKKEDFSKPASETPKVKSDASPSLLFLKKPPDPALAIICIEQMDFSKIVANLITGYKWSREDAHDVCRQYRNYLFLLVKYPEKILIPSELIEEFWRHHILDTQRYFKDCNAIFGHYLHYYPYACAEDLKEIFLETKRLYWHEFGEVLTETAVNKKKWYKNILKVEHC